MVDPNESDDMITERLSGFFEFFHLLDCFGTATDDKRVELPFSAVNHRCGISCDNGPPCIYTDKL